MGILSKQAVGYISHFVLAGMVLIVLNSNCVSAETCRVSITAPTNGKVVKHNRALSDYYSFTIEGRVANLDDNVICVYEKIPGGREWWRSGEPIDKHMISENGEWSMLFATCGDKVEPHPSCSVKALVQKRCPKTGALIQKFDAYLCQSRTITIITDH